MRKTLVSLAFCSAALGLAVAAVPAQAASAQTHRMTECSGNAKAKHLHGAARKQFMKSCLRSKKPAAKAAHPHHAKAGMNAQQQKMVSCNANAKSKGLKGDARKHFMKMCLRGKKHA